MDGAPARRRTNGFKSYHGPARTRGSYRIFSDDKFFICLDNFGPEHLADIDYYIKDRRHRKDYEHMIPLLRRVREVVHAEQTREKPFRDLLLAKLNEANPQAECTPERLDGLIRWWKLKTKEHRALLSDDQKAFRMIMEEYARQVSAGAVEVPAELSAALAADPSVLAAWHKGGNEYLVLLAMGHPVFAQESTWRVVGTAVVKGISKPWIVPVKKTYLRWPQVHTTEAWTQRPESPDPRAWLTATEIQEVIEWAKDTFSKRDNKEDKLIAIYASRDKTCDDVRLVLADEFHSRGWGVRRRQSPNPALLESMDEPGFTERGVRWSGAISHRKYSIYHLSGTATYVGSGSFHGETKGLRKGWEQKDTELLWSDAECIAHLEKAIADRVKHNARADALRSWAREMDSSAENFLLNEWRELQRVKYLEEAGDPDFFADHLKTVMPPEIELEGFTELVQEMITKLGENACQLLEGMTVPAALTLTGQKLKKPSAQLRQIAESSWVFHGKAKLEEDDEDDEDESDDGEESEEE